MADLFQWAQHLPSGLLYLFIFAWLFVESTGFPISDEPLLLLAGYLAHIQRIDLVPAIGSALAGKVAASFCAYWLGGYVDLSALARPPVRPASGLGRWLYLIRPTEGSVQVAVQRFREHGAWGVFLGRLVPVVRSFISYPAGAARMPVGTFLAATTAGSLVWILTWMLLGVALGKSYDVALARWGFVSWVVVALFLLALSYLAIRGHRRRARTLPDGEPAEPQRPKTTSRGR